MTLSVSRPQTLIHTIPGRLIIHRLYPGKIHGGLRGSYSLLRMRLDMSIPGVTGKMIWRCWKKVGVDLIWAWFTDWFLAYRWTVPRVRANWSFRGLSWDRITWSLFRCWRWSHCASSLLSLRIAFTASLV